MSILVRGAARRRLLNSFLFVLLLLGGAAPAQAQTGSVTGFVTDQVGTRIPSATISAISGPSAGAQTSSAANGSYTLTGLVAGNYTLRATANGFQSQARTVTVVAGSTSRLDFSLPSNQPVAGVLTGTITRTDTREPVPGAEVQISRGAGFPAVVLQTDANGVYRLENLETGSYLVEVDRDGFSGQRRRFTVRTGRITLANFALRPRAVELGIVQGTVVNSTGDRLSNVTITLTEGATSSTTRTNRSGFYRFTRVVPDAYVVEVAAGGFETQRIPATVGAGQRVVVDAVIEEEAPATLAIEGFVVDEFGTPISGALVQVTAGPRVGRSDVTDNLGFYRLENLPPGTYTLRATATGFSADTESIVLNEVVQPGRVDFQLATLPDQQRGTISGRVTDAQGNELEGVTVRVTAGPSTGQTTTTDDDGDYVISDLPVGTYSLSFTRSGFAGRTITGVNVTNGQTTVLDVALTGTAVGTGSLAGVVRDDETGSVLSGVTVRLSRNSTVVGTTTTNAQGRYTFLDLEAGTYSVRFSLDGFTTDTRTATVRENLQTTLDVRLQPGATETGTITGQVRDNGGRPIQNALVELSGDGEPRSVRTNEDGQFTLTGVSVGTFTLQASAPGLEPDEQLVRVQSGATTSVTFTLSSTGTAGTITGGVFSPSGLPIPALITIVRGPVVGDSRNTSSNGRFTFTGLPGGTYTLQVQSPGFRTRQVNVIVRAGSSSTVSIFLPR